MRFRFPQSLIRGVAVCAVTALGAISQSSAQAPAYDILITNGRLVDGTGNPWYLDDVAVRNGKIVAIGRLKGTATRTVDATGLVVSPGFIDLHTHTELLGNPLAQSKVREGVTLDIMGEGGSVAPRDPNAERGGRGGGGGRGGRAGGATWTDFNGYFAALEKQGFAINIASYVGGSTIRSLVMGYDTGTPSPEQMARMKRLMSQAMEQGAMGLSTQFESGGPDHPDEIIELAKIAGEYDGIFGSHIGSEGFQQEKEIGFVVRLAREARVPAHIFHFKIRAEENWGTIGNYIAQIEAARSEGLDITANEYPYTAMFHGWSAFFPVWARQGGQFAERLKDPAIRQKIHDDPDFKLWSKEHGGWDGIVMARANTPGNQKYEGKSVAQIAKLRGDSDPAITCINLMAEEGGGISGVFHTMSEKDVQTVMKLPWVTVASDGSAIDLTAAGVPHPRNYGTNPRVLGHYVRDEKTLSLEDAVRKMTSLPAQILGLPDRGQIHEGFAADIVLFDPNKVKDTNSFEQPKSYPEGIPYVIVNGVLVIDKGQHTGATPGQVIRGRGFKKQL
jgi:N-acyl-D-amino-acid deacylase